MGDLMVQKCIHQPLQPFFGAFDFQTPQKSRQNIRFQEVPFEDTDGQRDKIQGKLDDVVDLLNELQWFSHSKVQVVQDYDHKKNIIVPKYISQWCEVQEEQTRSGGLECRKGLKVGENKVFCCFFSGEAFLVKTKALKQQTFLVGGFNPSEKY